MLVKDKNTTTEYAIDVAELVALRSGVHAADETPPTMQQLQGQIDALCQCVEILLHAAPRPTRAAVLNHLDDKLELA